LVCVVSVALSATDKKIANTIETMAPWMQPEEAQMLVEHVQQMAIYERMPNNRELGLRMRLTNAEREALKLWPIKPVDMTDEQLAEQRKAKSREGRAARRRQSGVRTRDQYLAELASRPKPWEVEGIHRRTWERRRARDTARSVPTSQQTPQGSDATIVIKLRTHLATAEQGVGQKGQQGRGEAEEPRDAKEVKQVEKEEQRGSPALRPHLATTIDPRMAALNNWGANLKNRSAQKDWSKPTILSDEPRDFIEFPLEQGELAA
jgi:hypothetical protein